MRVIYLLLLALLAFSHTAVANEPSLIISERYYIIDDDKPEYAQQGIDRTGWNNLAFNGFAISDNIVWIQVDYQLPQLPATNEVKPHYGVMVSILGSFEAYWDGELIGENGVVGRNKDEETPGLIDKVMLIPSHSDDAGNHTLSLRISSHHVPAGLRHGSFYSLVSDYNFISEIPYKKASLPLIMSSALLLVALYSLIVFVTSYRQASYLIFSLLCFSILSLMLIESWRGIMPYTYNWQIPRLQWVLALSCLTSILFTAFFTWFFELSKASRLTWLGIALVAQTMILVMLNGYDNRSLAVFLVGVISAIGLCLQAIIAKQNNASLMFAGLILFIAPISINNYAYMDQYFFLSFSALIVLMLYTLAQTISRKQQQLVQSQITSTRLELELVKRNLQPHFILNTLTAIEEWIEDSPATAITFIHALADEFRFMASTSARTIITLQEEIDLCNSHLRVMGFRTNIEYSLAVQARQLEALLPPGVLLTLVENAISHNYYKQGNICFRLVQKIEAQQQVLIFSAPVSSKTSLLVSDNQEKRINLGIGSQYIEARLNESFNNQWHITSQLVLNNWQVQLSFPFNVQSRSLTTER